MKTIVIAAGGTGGHISPGVALAEALMQNKEKYGFEKLYIHSLNRNRDNPDLKSAPCELIWHNSPPITKMFFLFPFPFIYNLIKTILRFQKEKVDCVISMGGYSSVPALLYALFFRKKIFLCEQNRVIGKVNRIFLKYANKIAFSFPPITQKEIRVPHIVAGNPIRSKILPESKTKEFPKSPEERIHVLVMGGSQGARQINNMVLNSMENPEISKNFLFRILTGTALYEETITKIRGPIEKDNIISYSVNMKEHYDWAHLVIARSGAGVISECIAFGLPMILIPYPYASDNHQMENAKFCEECCGAKIIASKEEDSSILIKYLLEINQNPELLSKIYAQTCKDAKLQSSVNTIDFFFLSQDETSRK